MGQASEGFIGLVARECAFDQGEDRDVEPNPSSRVLTRYRTPFRDSASDRPVTIRAIASATVDPTSVVVDAVCVFGR